MTKTILITGATDGIGLATARLLVAQGHTVLLHGRSAEKLKTAQDELKESGMVEGFLADLSRLNEVENLAADIAAKHDTLDVVINNAGILKTPATTTPDGFDTRFAVNTFAPALLTKLLLPLMPADGRVINLSSAAQSPVDLQALSTSHPMQDMEAYAQSKLALTMWSFHMGKELGANGPAIIAVNPGSLLGSKMVKEGFGIAGKGLDIGAQILVRAALSDEFAQATGQYFDNDIGQFGAPHPDALDASEVTQVVAAIDAALTRNT
ncbi:Putative ketoacyl reductase [Roseovarius albus]|uniref:Putative ketoacyl reductase n=1 Tax=Roseovarius albus TaxID=1247867 RepID=A0A1X6YCF1_9RHOB|nr:SDR family NAD(P)-dependent oxidoreductase [Roseovarius albus]SLN16945.1 Putative ketoacyl reductase [Roseovarius albus]